MKILYAIYFLLFLFSGIPVRAQVVSNDSLPEIWTLENCLGYAKANNITINSLRLNRAVSEQNLVLAKAAVLPDLNGSVSQGFTHYNEGSPFIASAGNTGVSSTWTLYNGGYLRNNITQKDLSVQSAALSTLEAKNDITLQIVQAYLNILLDKETIIYQQDVVTTSQAQVEQMQYRFDAGSIAKKDLIQIQSQLANDKYILTTAQNAERQDKLTLKQLLQLPVEAAFDVVKPDSTLYPQAATPLNEAIALAMEKRPEIKNNEISIDIADLELKKAIAGYKPVISVNGGVGTNYGTNGIRTFTQLGDNLYQQIGITASIPIFSRKQNKTNEAKAKINIEQATLDLKNTKVVLSQAVEQAYINTQNAATQLDASVNQLQYAEEVYRIAGESIQIGAYSMVEFIQQKNLYIQALQSYIQAKYKALLSNKIYEFYKGDPVTL